MMVSIVWSLWFVFDTYLFRCTLDLEGENRKRHTSQKCRLDNTGKPEKDCRFYPYQDNRATASIMSHAFVSSVCAYILTVSECTLIY